MLIGMRFSSIRSIVFWQYGHHPAWSRYRVIFGLSLDPKRRSLFCTNGPPVPFILDSCSEFNAAPTAVFAAADCRSDQLLVLIVDIESLVLVGDKDVILGLVKLATTASRNMNGRRIIINGGGGFVMVIILRLELELVKCMRAS